jgi:hypothetical protein
MDYPKLLQKTILAGLIALSGQVVMGQVRIKGTVYDRSVRFAMPGVSVLGTSGGGTVTDSAGHYSIRLPPGDSIYFSYLGKATAKFPVREIDAALPFDMSLQVAIDSLPSVFVDPRDYRMDSLQNRIEYKKVFDFETGYIPTANSGGAGMGIDMDRFFDGRANRRMQAFQQRLEQEEKDAYIDHRFTRSLVIKITGLESPALDSFMRIYRPSYELVQSCATDYEFYKYIFDWAKSFSEIWKSEHSN